MKTMKTKFGKLRNIIISFALLLPIFSGVVFASEKDGNFEITRAGNGNVIGMKYSSLDGVLYESTINLTTSENATISYQGHGGGSVDPLDLNTPTFPCGTGELLFKVAANRGYKFVSEDASVSELTKFGNKSDFIKIDYNEAMTEANVTIKHAPAYVGLLSQPLLEKFKHFHGTSNHSQLSISLDLKAGVDKESDYWKHVTYYSDNKGKDDSIFNKDPKDYVENDTLNLIVGPDHDKTHVFLGWTTKPDAIDNKEMVVNDKEIILQLIKDEQFFAANAQYKIGKSDVNFYAVYGKENLFDEEVNVSYTVEHWLPGATSGSDSKIIESKVLESDPHILAVDAASIQALDKYLTSGYKFKNYTVDGQTVNFVSGSTIADGKTIKVNYEKDETQRHNISYKVQYYKDGKLVEGDTITKTVSEWINDSKTPLQNFDKSNDKYVGYKFANTDPERLPDQVTDGTIIKVNYVKDEDQWATVTFNKGNHGTIDGQDENGNVISKEVLIGTTLGENEIIAPTITADAGWKVATIQWDNEYKQSMQVRKNLVFTAQYEEVIVPVGPTTPQTPIGPTTQVVTQGNIQTVQAPAVEQIQKEKTPTAKQVVKDEKTPLANGNGNEGWALMNLIYTGAAIIMAIFVILSKNKKEKEAENYKRSKMVKFVSVLVALSAIIVFVLTENITLPMILIDKWTFLMSVIAIAQIIVLLISRKWKQIDDKNDEAVA